MKPFFVSILSDCTIGALVGDDTICFMRDYDSVAMPLDAALDVAVETLRLLLDDHRLRTHHGEGLGTYLGKADQMELRRILGRIGGPEGPYAA